MKYRRGREKQQYAHLLDADTEDRCKTDVTFCKKVADKLADMRRRFPETWKSVLIGNKRADKLTHYGAEKMAPIDFTKEVQRYELFSVSGDIIQGNKLHVIKKAFDELRLERWKAAQPARAAYLVHKQVDFELTTAQMSPSFFIKKDRTKFYHKLWTSSLPTMHKVSCYLRSERWLDSLGEGRAEELQESTRTYPARVVNILQEWRYRKPQSISYQTVVSKSANMMKRRKEW